MPSPWLTQMVMDVPNPGGGVDDRRTSGAMTRCGDQQLPIWHPDPGAVAGSAMARFGRYATGRTGLEFGTYLDMQRCSVDHLEEF